MTRLSALPNAFVAAALAAAAGAAPVPETGIRQINPPAAASGPWPLDCAFPGRRDAEVIPHTGCATRTAAGKILLTRATLRALPFDGHGLAGFWLAHGRAAVCVGCTLTGGEEERTYVGGAWGCIDVHGVEVVPLTRPSEPAAAC